MVGALSEDIELIEFKGLVFPETHDLFVLLVSIHKANEELETRLDQIKNYMKYEIHWVDVDEFQYYVHCLGRQNLLSDGVLSVCNLPNFFVVKSAINNITKDYQERKAKERKNE